MNRLFYIWTIRFCLALLFLGIAPEITSNTILVAQSKKKNPTQASKYAKRGSAKAKKKDFRGALSDYKKAYQLRMKHVLEQQPERVCAITFANEIT